MSLFSAKKGREADLILDIESAAVRGSVVLCDGSAEPDVLFTYNAGIPWKPHTDSGYLVKTTLKAVKETVEASRRYVHIHSGKDAMPKKIGTIHFILSSPWIISEAKTLSREFSKNEVVTEALVLKVIREEKSDLNSADKNEIVPIEQKIFDVKLNGYSISDWKGKITKRLDVSFSRSMASQRMMDKFRDVVEHALHRTNLRFHSSLLMQHIGFGSIMPHVPDFGLIHIHGELTDVVLCMNHISTYFGSYPIGINTLVRKLAIATSTKEQAADSLLSLYIGGHIDAGHDRKAVEKMQELAHAWSEELKRSLSKDCETCSIPESLIVISGSHDKFFVKALRDIYPKATVGTIDMDDIASHASFADKAERTVLTALYAKAVNTINSSP